MILNRYNIIFIGMLIFHFLVLLYLANDFSISYKESLIYYEKNANFLTFLTNLSTKIFGQNDIALRLPFIIFYLGSAIILYALTNDYFKYQIDRIISIAIFMALPGINSAALLVNESIVVVFFTLLYLYLYKLNDKEYYILLVLFLFIDNSFAILFLALFFYSMVKKDNLLLVVSLILFGISMSMYGFEIGGKPKGYFLDTFAIYASIFSPLLFLYFFYSIYRVGIKKMEKDMYWYISVTALGLSLLFSLRQKIQIEDFAPFVVIAIPLMVKLFMHSLRVRLKEFRKVHYTMFFISITILVLNFITLVFNKYLYIFINKPSKHFAYKHHVAKELSQKLKQMGVSNIFIYDNIMAKRLEFYNISNIKQQKKLGSYKKNNSKIIEIKYYNKIIKRFYINN